MAWKRKIATFSSVNVVMSPNYCKIDRGCPSMTIESCLPSLVCGLSENPSMPFLIASSSVSGGLKLILCSSPRE